LNEIAAYIAANHHLPDVPSAAAMKQNGIGVAEMQSKLLAKIEELTLHMIDMQKENLALRSEVSSIKARMEGAAK
jgi:hypothetical protein